MYMVMMVVMAMVVGMVESFPATSPDTLTRQVAIQKIIKGRLQNGNIWTISQLFLPPPLQLETANFDTENRNIRKFGFF